MLSFAAALLAFLAPTEIPFDEPRAVRSRPAVRVVFGTVPCELPVRYARVRETDKRVVITLIGQLRPPGTVCAQVLQLGCVEVPLRRRVGGRRVVDGSTRSSTVDSASARRARAAGCARVRVVRERRRPR